MNEPNNQDVNSEVTPQVMQPINPQQVDFMAPTDMTVQPQEMQEIPVNNEFVYEDEPKRNKKLLIIVLLLLLLFAFGGFFGFRWYQDKLYNDWLQKIRDGAQAHVEGDKELEKSVLNYEIDKIFLKDVVSAGKLTNLDLINPKTKKEISGCNFVEVAISSGSVLYQRVTTNNNTCPDNKPVITLIGTDTMEITQGDTYSEPGATAYDVDGTNISNKLIKTGDVNVQVPGTYTITYNVKNTAGLSADEKIRTVTVVAKGGTTGGGNTSGGSGGGNSGGGNSGGGTSGGDKIKPSISITGLNSVITSGQSDGYTITFSDNVKLSKITYCTTTCKTETVSLKRITKSFTFAYKTAGTYVIKASAYDSKGNKVLVSRTVQVINGIDNTKPKITLVSAPSTVKAGEDFVVSAKFEDNVGIIEYTLCAGDGASQVCRTEKFTSPRDYVIVPLTAKNNVVGTHKITASANDSNIKNYTGNLRIGSFEVTPSTVVSTTPTIARLNKEVVSGKVGEPLTISVKYDGMTPNKIINYTFCYRLGSGNDTCNTTTVTPSTLSVTKDHIITPTVAGTYVFSAHTYNNSPSGSYSGNKSLGNVVITD